MDLETSIKQIFTANNNKVQYKVLAEKFQDKFLENDDFKVKFKKLVGKLATLKEENGDKYLILKSKYQRKGSEPAISKSLRPDGLKSSVLDALLNGKVSEDDNLSLLDLDFYDSVDPPNDEAQPDLPSDHLDHKLETEETSIEPANQLESAETSVEPANQSLSDESCLNISSDSDSIRKLLRPLSLKLDKNLEADLARSEENPKDITPAELPLPCVPHLSHSEPDLQSCDNFPSDGTIRITVNNVDQQTEARNDAQGAQGTPQILPLINVQKSGSESNMADVTVKNRSKMFENKENLQKTGLQIKNNKFRQSHKDDSASPENGSVASISVSDVERKWLINAVKCDYQSLSKSLSINPDLVSYADFTCGYCALHWAAKFGNLDCIKLLAGTFKGDLDRKSGYTPLHLAAMHGQYAAMDLLIKTYGANSNIRDNSGRRAEHYVNNVCGTKRVKLADMAAHKSMSTSTSSARSHSPTKCYVKNSYSSQSLPSPLQMSAGYIRIGSIRKAGAAAFNRLKGHATSAEQYDDCEQDDVNQTMRPPMAVTKQKSTKV